MPEIIKVRRDTKAHWADANPVLAAGEPGIETDAFGQKFGDGVTPWNELPYYNGSNSGGSSVNESQQLWIMQKMAEEKLEKANNLFVIETEVVGETSYLADERQSAMITVVVRTKFGVDASPVDCDTIPSGWERTNKGVYVKTATAVNGNNATVAASEFSYTPSSGEYAGITVRKNSESRVLAAIYPFYYGWGSSNDVNQSYLVVKSLIRVTNNTGSGIFSNKPDEKSWFWIIVPKNRTANASQQGLGIMKPYATVSMVSPQNSDITIVCNVYVSDRSFTSTPNDISWQVK